MDEKKIIIKIKEDGAIHAETSGMVGTECTIELDKLMKDLATNQNRIKKKEYFKEKTTNDNSVKVNNG